ncbi:branched-chain amino acid aminotransferase [Alkalispirochaeta americana]|uniref:branched-chain-amino-acid transaminase n=1 Tax=Alkalispirochaeta americana TaxID=159291 RepID=A0A1N6N8H1_9SPIO|nr:aminotransferase class IV [Alkalispirochaeta americana]SIP88350.1 branched-chain amino acid aminotransferase [Alkalispirochaeta americana]
MKEIRLELRPEGLREVLQEAPEPLSSHGVYLVARTWQGDKVLDLDGHFQRLEDSARALGHDLHVPREQIRSILANHLPGRYQESRESRKAGDIRFRVAAMLEDPPWYGIHLEEARPVPPEILREGARCRIQRGAARNQPEVKAVSWIHRRQAFCAGGAEQGGYEYLLTDDQGRILEGATSNVYAVMDGVLRTAGEGVLQGIARKIVLRTARDLLPLELSPVKENDLPRVRELFISSATRGVVPVSRIDDHLLGPPGEITREISSRYNRWLADHLEPLVLPGSRTDSG